MSRLVHSPFCIWCIFDIFWLDVDLEGSAVLMASKEKKWGGGGLIFTFKYGVLNWGEKSLVALFVPFLPILDVFLRVHTMGVVRLANMNTYKDTKRKAVMSGSPRLSGKEGYWDLQLLFYWFFVRLSCILFTL